MVDVSSQLDEFTSASTQRNTEFRHRFKLEDDDGDTLVEDHPATLSSGVVPISGTLYVSKNRAAFWASTLGWTTKLVLLFIDVERIEKTNMMFLFENAITVTTADGQQFTFGSLAHRDAVYSILVNLHRVHRPSNSPSHPDSISGLKHTSSAPLRMPTTDQSELTLEASSPPTPSQLSPRPPGTPRQTSKGSLLPRVASTLKKVSTRGGGGGVGAAGSGEEGRVERELKCRHKDLKSIALDRELPLPPRKLFELLLVNDFVPDYWRESGSISEISIGDWSRPPLPSTPSSPPATRSVSYLKRLSFAGFGPSSTHCYVTEEASTCEAGYSWLTITRTPDVPYGGSFAVRSLSCVTWPEGTKRGDGRKGDKGRARLRVSTEVEWFGRCMVKSVVEKPALEGQKTYGEKLIERIENYVKEHPEWGQVGENDMEDHTAPASASKEGKRDEANGKALPEGGFDSGVEVETPISPAPDPDPSAAEVENGDGVVKEQGHEQEGKKVTLSRKSGSLIIKMRDKVTHSKIWRGSHSHEQSSSSSSSHR